MNSFSAALAQAGEWLLRSGIQAPDGGVARYYRADLERNQPVSFEITGYAASAFVYLYEKTGRTVYADRARLTARFLAEKAWDHRAQTFPFESLPSSPAYFFDCGIIVRGLLSVWRMSGDSCYLERAIGGGESMLRDFDAGVDFHPILDLPSKKPPCRDFRWSRSSGCYQLKAAMAWRELADITGRQEFSSAFERVLKFAACDWKTFLSGSEDENHLMDRLHAFGYYLEALVSYGHPVRDHLARAAALREEIAPRFVRSDVYAQLLRVRLLSGDLLAAAPSEVHSLAQFQVQAGSARVFGGFYFGRREGKFIPHLNPVSTIFAMQALEMWREHNTGTLERDCRVLI